MHANVQKQNWNSYVIFLRQFEINNSAIEIGIVNDLLIVLCVKLFIGKYLNKSFVLCFSDLAEINSLGVLWRDQRGMCAFVFVFFIFLFAQTQSQCWNSNWAKTNETVFLCVYNSHKSINWICRAGK